MVSVTEIVVNNILKIVLIMSHMQKVQILISSRSILIILLKIVSTIRTR